MVNIQNVTGILKDNALTIGAGIGGIALGTVVGAAAVSKSSKPRKRRSSSSWKRKSGSSRKKARKRTTPYTARKRRDTSMRRIRHTKNGQPYVILASGKAKFISKKSAKMSRKRSGGKY